MLFGVFDNGSNTFGIDSVLEIESEKAFDKSLQDSESSFYDNYLSEEFIFDYHTATHCEKLDFTKILNMHNRPEDFINTFSDLQTFNLHQSSLFLLVSSWLKEYADSQGSQGERKRIQRAGGSQVSVRRSLYWEVISSYISMYQSFASPGGESDGGEPPNRGIYQLPNGHYIDFEESWIQQLLNGSVSTTDQILSLASNQVRYRLQVEGKRNVRLKTSSSMCYSYALIARQNRDNLPSPDEVVYFRYPENGPQQYRFAQELLEIVEKFFQGRVPSARSASTGSSKAPSAAFSQSGSELERALGLGGNVSFTINGLLSSVQTMFFSSMQPLPVQPTSPSFQLAPQVESNTSQVAPQVSNSTNQKISTANNSALIHALFTNLMRIIASMTVGTLALKKKNKEEKNTRNKPQMGQGRS